MNMERLLENVMKETTGCIQVYQETSGEQVDFEELSVEVDHDPTAFKPQLDFLWITNPLQLMRASHR